MSNTDKVVHSVFDKLESDSYMNLTDSDYTYGFIAANGDILNYALILIIREPDANVFVIEQIANNLFEKERKEILRIRQYGNNVELVRFGFMPMKKEHRREVKTSTFKGELYSHRKIVEELVLPCWIKQGKYFPVENEFTERWKKVINTMEKYGSTK